MATGYYAARVANVQPGDSVIVLGDSAVAVGLSAIIAAKLRGAKQIISTSRHADREALAHEFCATDNVAERDEEGIKKLLDVTRGGADAVLECVGSKLSMQLLLVAYWSSLRDQWLLYSWISLILLMLVAICY